MTKQDYDSGRQAGAENYIIAELHASDGRIIATFTEQQIIAAFADELIEESLTGYAGELARSEATSIACFALGRLMKEAFAGLPASAA